MTMVPDLRRAAACLLLAAAWAPAQTASFRVSPAALAAKEGPTGDDYPFGVPLIRYQQIHDDVKERLFVDGLAFRRDGVRTTAMNRWSVELEAHMATARVAAQLMSNTFLSNRGADFTQVLGRTTVHFPDLPLPASPPAPFAVELPFGLAFPFKAQGSLLWEVAVFGNSQAGKNDIKVFNFLDCQAPTLVRGEAFDYGPGCAGSHGRVPVLEAWVRSDGFFRALLHDGPPLASGFTILGVSEQRWFTTKLPLDLGPIGAPGCALRCDVVVLWPLFVDGLGNGLNQLANVPLTAEMEGVPLFLQCMLADAPANPLGIALTQAVRLLVPPGRTGTGVSRLYSLGDLQASQGLRDLGYGLVARFAVR